MSRSSVRFRQAARPRGLCVRGTREHRGPVCFLGLSPQTPSQEGLRPCTPSGSLRIALVLRSWFGRVMWGLVCV
jgi:hypothetical protein